MTADVIAGVVCWLVSLSAELIPGLRELWDKIDAKWKPLVFLVLCLLITFALPLLTCVGVDFETGAVCPVVVDAEFVVGRLFVAYAAWGVASATFGYVQAPLGARITARG